MSVSYEVYGFGIVLKDGHFHYYLDANFIYKKPVSAKYDCSVAVMKIISDKKNK